MLIFFDTEFTGLGIDPRLISIGLITEDGAQSFYAELTDTYQPADCAAFVHEAVIPYLQGGDKRCHPTARRYLKPAESRFLTHDSKLVQGKDLFEHADRLTALLAQFPYVEIVISSSWREHFRPGKLLSLLPEALALRVIGQTPVCDKYGGVGSRLNEILAYLHGNGLADHPWIALDDQAQLFWDDTENPTDNLIITHASGLTETNAKELIEKLQTHSFSVIV